MATRLTGFSKLIITLLILATIMYAGWYVLNNTQFGQQLKEEAEKEVQAKSENDKASLSKTKGDSGDKVLRVQLVTWGGYAPGLFYNKGAIANKKSLFYKEYGFEVEFTLENDLINALNSWIAGEYDVLVQTADAFPLYTSPDDINAYNPKIFMQVDWSRGGDAIIVKRGINNVNDLKGKNVAVAVPSPAQTMLITALDAANLDYEDVNVIETTDNLKAAELFKSKDVDVAVVWSPDDILATQDVPGSKILLTTREMSHIIADVMFAKGNFIKNNAKMINGFYEGWMKGVAAINSSDANRKEAAGYLAELNELNVDDALGMMDNVYLTGHGDNVNFFGLNSDFKGHKGADLYDKMNREFVQIKASEKKGPPWRSVIYTGAAKSASSLVGTQYDGEHGKVFKTASASDRVKTPIASKNISISFATGQYELTPNAKTIIDLQFSEIAKSFGNTRIRIEGNTDNVGGRTMNVNLSLRRADAVKRYLQSEYKIDVNRFITIGNGPDKPVPGCEKNNSEDCRAKNRRTEFQLIAG